MWWRRRRMRMVRMGMLMRMVLMMREHLWMRLLLLLLLVMVCEMMMMIGEGVGVRVRMVERRYRLLLLLLLMLLVVGCSGGRSSRIGGRVVVQVRGELSGHLWLDSSWSLLLLLIGDGWRWRLFVVAGRWRRRWIFNHLVDDERRWRWGGGGGWGWRWGRRWGRRSTDGEVRRIYAVICDCVGGGGAIVAKLGKRHGDPVAVCGRVNDRARRTTPWIFFSCISSSCNARFVSSFFLFFVFVFVVVVAVLYLIY